ncbi:WD40 repeat-like protein [Gigaspora margarita]|uniref:WD40 repeat-like protein n=1 Tax=Gigaspora margarita TaxID=4874 RepID=A0A8H4A5T6_GIGMA|nr:WD40 repeat-like protein [Gigaspora margarita]
MKGKNHLNQQKNENETLCDINMDLIRSQYNSTGPTDMRSFCIRAKNQLRNLLKIFQSYISDTRDPVRDAKYFSKWEKNLKKLNGFIDQINRNGSNFELPQELKCAKLSTLSAEYILQDLIHTHIGTSSFDSSNINASKSHKNLTRIHEKLTSSEVEDSGLVVGNPLFMKDVITNYNKPLLNEKKAVITPSSQTSYKRTKSSFESPNRNKWREEKPGHIVLLDSDEENENDTEDKPDPVVIILSDDETCTTDRSSTSSVSVTTAQKSINRSNTKIQLKENTQSYHTLKNSKKYDSFRILDAGKNELYIKLAKEKELEKASISKIRDVKLQKAIDDDYNDRILEQETALPKVLDQTIGLLTYLSKHDIVSEKDTELVSTITNSNTVEVLSPEIGIINKFKKLKSFNFKCGSGDVNETALNLSNPQSPVLAVAYIASRDPRYNQPGNLQLLDIARGEAYNLYGHVALDLKSKTDLWTSVTDVKFSADGNFIFSASTDATIKIWQIDETRNFKKPYDTKVCQSQINRLAVSQKPKAGSMYQFASCEDSGLVQVHSLRKDQYKYILTSQEFQEEKCCRAGSDVLFGPENLLIVGHNGVTGDNQGVVKVWDVNTRKKECYMKCYFSSSISCLDMSHYGKWVACGTTGVDNEEGDGRMWIWNLQCGSKVYSTTQEKDANVISVSHDDKYIALGGISNTVYVFDPRKMNMLLYAFKHDDPNDGLPHDGIMSLHWIPGSSLLISGGNDNCVRIWDVNKCGKQNPLVYQFAEHDSPVTSVRLSPDLSLMTVGVSTGKIYIYSSNESFIQAGNKLKYL